MSTIPKDYTDNYSPNVQKITSSGDIVPHPRMSDLNLSKAKQTAGKLITDQGLTEEDMLAGLLTGGASIVLKKLPSVISSIPGGSSIGKS